MKIININSNKLISFQIFYSLEALYLWHYDDKNIIDKSEYEFIELNSYDQNLQIDWLGCETFEHDGTWNKAHFIRAIKLRTADNELKCMPYYGWVFDEEIDLSIGIKTKQNTEYCVTQCQEPTINFDHVFNTPDLLQFNIEFSILKVATQSKQIIA